MSIHLISPLIYIIFVKLFYFVSPNPESHKIKLIRKIYNISMSFLSIIMLISITISTYSSNKLKSLDSLLCLPYNNNILIYWSTYIILYSKYIEWFDTLFLHLSDKPISWLQYTHHMSTTILVYVHIHDNISPLIFVFQALNCFVHIPMYWYFAYPKGFLSKF